MRVLSDSVKTCFKSPSLWRQSSSADGGLFCGYHRHERNHHSGEEEQEWKKEKTQFTRDGERQYGWYKPLDEEMSRLRAVNIYICNSI